MDLLQIGQLVAFLVLSSALLILLEIGLRRDAKRRRRRRGHADSLQIDRTAVRRGDGVRPGGR